MQSRYYSPKTGRFLNADGMTTTGQGLLGNNMFAYCNNSPVLLSDPSGQIAIEAILSTLKKMVISGTINLATSALSALFTNQKFTFRDGIWAFIAGAGSGVHPILGGTIGGGYTAYSSYENGASTGQIILSSVTSFCCTAFSLGGLAQYLDDWAAVFVEATFTFASNLLSSGVYKGVSNNIPTYDYNINAVPWSSPDYMPYTSTVPSSTPNYNAFPWSSPDYLT